MGPAQDVRLKGRSKEPGVNARASSLSDADGQIGERSPMMIHALRSEPQGQRQRFEPREQQRGEQQEQDRHIHLHFHLNQDMCHFSWIGT